jgi:hypothetical protein
MTVLNLLLAAHEEIVAAPATIQQRPRALPIRALTCPTRCVSTYEERYLANYLTSGSVALVSAFIGMFLPMVPTVGPIQRPTNLLFGFVYGLGWFVGGFIDDVRSRYVETFGSIIWPIVVILMVTYFLRRLLSDYRDRRFVIVLCCIFLLFLIVPGAWVAKTPLKYIPTYSSILLSVY